MKLIHLLVISVTYVSFSFASYGKVRIYGGGSYGRLEFKQRDGEWGTVCNRGFNDNAASVACKQLGYDYGYYDGTSNLYVDDSKPIAVCDITCYGDEDQLKDCPIFQSCDHDFNFCSHDNDVTISCYDSPYNDDSTSTGSSSGAIIGSTLGIMFIFIIIIFLVICRVYVRYSYIRRNRNRTYIVTRQEGPQVLVARVTHTASSGPPPPPAYTPSAPDAGYTAVPPRGYHPVPTTDYSPAQPTNTTSVAPDDIPSDPPPEYTPTVSTNVPMPAPEDSAQ